MLNICGRLYGSQQAVRSAGPDGAVGESFGANRQQVRIVIVCICFMVSDRRIAELAADAATTYEISARCGAGRDCGRCVVDIQDILDAIRHQSSKPPKRFQRFQPDSRPRASMAATAEQQGGPTRTWRAAASNRHPGKVG